MRITVIIGCTLSFLSQFYGFIMRHIDGDTFVAIVDEHFTSLSLPYVTVCPGIRSTKQDLHYKMVYFLAPGWKSSVMPVRVDQWKTSVFKLNEIFVEKTVTMLMDTKQYRVTEMTSELFGVCYTIQKLENVTLAQYDPELGLIGNMDVNIIIHAKDEEKWLLFGIFPYDLPILYLEANNTKNIGAIDLAVQKTITTKMSRHNHECLVDADAAKYIDCVFEKISKMHVEEASCKTVLLERNGFEFDKNLHYCQNTSETTRIHRLASDTMKRVLRDRSCNPMCTQVAYDPAVKKYHNFVLYPKNRVGYRIWLSYASLRVEIRNEEYIYGIETTMSAIGGSMGLILGLSCLSFSLNAFDFLESKILERW